MKAIIYQTFDEIPKRFLCLYCFNFAKIPVKCYAMYCQAIYCHRCNNFMKENNIQCKKCTYDTSKQQIDVITQYIMESMQIICTICKQQIKASKYQKHINNCNQNQYELDYLKHIQKQIDNFLIVICSYCNKKCGFQEFFNNNSQILQLFQESLNLCQCKKKLLEEDIIQSYLQNTFDCQYCQNQISFQDLTNHFQVCQFLLTNCQTEECQWKNKRAQFNSHFMNCINSRKQLISSTKKQVKRLLNSEELKLDAIRYKMDEINKYKKRILNLTFLNDSQQTEPIPQDERLEWDPRFNW